jgi:hypothetical protein
MAKKTVKLNVQVKLAKKAYQPGEPVPVGGKDGLSDDDVSRLTESFGLYTGDAVIGTPAETADADLAERDRRIAVLEAEKAEALEELKTARDEAEALKGQLAEAEADTGVLAARVKELEAAAK